LALDVGDLERQIDQSHAEFERRLMQGTRRKSRGDAWRNAAVAPGDHFAVLVQAGLNTFRRDRMQEVMADIVLSRPLPLDGRPPLLPEQRRLQPVSPPPF